MDVHMFLDLYSDFCKNSKNGYKNIFKKIIYIFN